MSNALGIPETRAELIALVRKAMPPQEAQAQIELIKAKTDDEVAEMLATLGLMVCREMLERAD